MNFQEKIKAIAIKTCDVAKVVSAEALSIGAAAITGRMASDYESDLNPTTQKLLKDRQSMLIEQMHQRGLVSISVTYEGHNGSSDVMEVTTNPHSSNTWVMKDAEILLYALLEDLHEGWCDDLGGEGLLYISAETGNITLSHRQRAGAYSLADTVRNHRFSINQDLPSVIRQTPRG